MSKEYWYMWSGIPVSKKRRKCGCPRRNDVGKAKNNRVHARV
jgi:hypothetical protein